MILKWEKNKNKKLFKFLPIVINQYDLQKKQDT